MRPQSKPMTSFVLHLQDIADAGKQFAFDLDASWMESALEGSELRPDPATPGSLAFFAQKSGSDVLVQGELHARFVATCSRCLGDAPVNVDTELSTLFTARGEGPLPEELELTPEDLERTTFSGDSIVLDPLVRELVLLENPIQPLCSEDCPGIEMPAHLKMPTGPTRDDGKPIDPRLLPLMQLAKKRERDEE